MPFGLTNAPATWQRTIDNVLGHDLEPHVFVYLDDVVIVTSTFEEHVRVLEIVCNRLRDAGLTINRDKCQFCRSELKYLGYVVDGKGLHVDPGKVQAILEIPVPKTVSEVRRILGMASWYRKFISNFGRILGMASWYRKFISNFAIIVAPLTDLLRKSRKFDWTSECEESFRKLKELFDSSPNIVLPRL
ncbi:Reverse transcriptase (RNA-dependent DNA polymerase) [Popillia japonica]|uniref:RNA-directed DNA polymerase n=1 Tax=Popillia japonica TaxID=7064 RepID=A0AAW1HUA9_POPJA